MNEYVIVWDMRVKNNPDWCCITTHKTTKETMYDDLRKMWERTYNNPDIDVIEERSYFEEDRHIDYGFGRIETEDKLFNMTICLLREV